MITSTSNEKVRRIIGISKKPKIRRQEDVFLVEGIKMVLEAPEDQLSQVIASESFLKKEKETLPERYRLGFASGRDALGTAYETVSDRVFAAMSDTQSPQGILCTVRQKHYRREELLGKKPLVMVLENLQDPGNLGTIIRTSEGAGVTGILMSASTADIYNPKVIRSTMGSVYRQPFYYSSDLKSDIAWLKDRGLQVYAAHLKGKNSYEQEDYTGGSAFMIGNESQGLTDETAQLADRYIRIPMLGQVESLNAAVASSILMYEAARQRRIHA